MVISICYAERTKPHEPESRKILSTANMFCSLFATRRPGVHTVVQAFMRDIHTVTVSVTMYACLRQAWPVYMDISPIQFQPSEMLRDAGRYSLGEMSSNHLSQVVWPVCHQHLAHN